MTNGQQPIYFKKSDVGLVTNPVCDFHGQYLKVQAEGRRVVWSENLRIASLFADDVVLLAASDLDLQRALVHFAAECEVAGRVSTSNSTTMLPCCKTVYCFLPVGSELSQLKEIT